MCNTEVGVCKPLCGVVWVCDRRVRDLRYFNILNPRIYALSIQVFVEKMVIVNQNVNAFYLFFFLSYNMPQSCNIY